MMGSRLDDDPLAWARASHAVRRSTSRQDWVRIGSQDVDRITSARLPQSDVQLHSLLDRIAEAVDEEAFASAAIDNDDLAGFVGVASDDNRAALVDHAVGLGLVARRGGDQLSLTPSGWAARRPPPTPAPTPRADPAVEVETSHCSDCGGDRAAEVVAHYDERIDGGDGETSAHVSVRTLRCRGCGALHVVREDSFSEDEEHVQDTRSGE